MLAGFVGGEGSAGGGGGGGGEGEHTNRKNTLDYMIYVTPTFTGFHFE